MGKKLPELSLRKLKQFSALKRKKERLETSLTLAEGSTLSLELVETGVRVEAVIVNPSRLDSSGLDRIVLASEKKKIPVFSADDPTIKLLSSSETPPPTISVVGYPGYSFIIPEKKRSFTLIVDGVQEPGNLGAILRTAAGFGVDFVYLTPKTCEVGNPKVIRGSMGAVYRVPVTEVKSISECVTRLKESGFSIIGTVVEKGTDYRVFATPSKCALVIGNEARGVGEIAVDANITINLKNRVESLNVSVALGVLLSRLL